MKNSVFILCLVFWGIFVLTPPVVGENLDEIQLNLTETLHRAAARHVSVIIAQERVQQSLARLEQNAASLLPQLTASVLEKRQTRDLSASGISLGASPLIGPFNSFDARVQLTQTLFDVSAWNRLKAARTQESLSLAEYQKVKEDVLAFVAILFVEAQKSHQSVAPYEILVRSDEKQLAIAQDRFHTGVGSELELKHAQANYAHSLNLLEMAKTEAMEKELDLKAALGIPLKQKIIFIDDDSQFTFLFPSEEDWEEILNEHPAYKVAQKEVQQKQVELSTQKAEYYPKISALADYGESGSEPRKSSETYTLGVQASLPIMDGGLRRARIREADSQLKEKQINLVDMTLRIETRALVAAQALVEAKAFLKQKEAELEIAQTESNLAQVNFDSGLGSELQLSTARAAEALAQNSKEDAVATHLMARVNMAHALGQLGAWAAAKDSR